MDKITNKPLGPFTIWCENHHICARNASFGRGYSIRLLLSRQHLIDKAAQRRAESEQSFHDILATLGQIAYKHYHPTPRYKRIWNFLFS